MPAIRGVHESAFGRGAEADLVDGLRGDAAWLPALSLVAETEDEILGHILFSRVFVVGEGRRSPGLSLAPVAVRSPHQRGGIGSSLIREGLQRARAEGEAFVVVLGHSDYYPRFGFTPAGPLGLGAPWDVRPESWMAMALRPDGLAGVAGMVEYPPPFASLP